MSASPNATAMYSIRDAAELFEVPEARLRYWAQTGFVGPSMRHQGRLYYAFADLIASRWPSA